MAAAFDCHALRANSPEDFAKALYAAAREDKPTIIEIDEYAYLAAAR